MHSFGGAMAKRSAIYLFKRDVRSPLGFMSRNEAATDAAGVVFNWAAAEGRSFQPLLDQHEIILLTSPMTEIGSGKLQTTLTSAAPTKA